MKIQIKCVLKNYHPCCVFSWCVLHESCQGNKMNLDQLPWFASFKLHRFIPSQGLRGLGQDPSRCAAKSVRFLCLLFCFPNQWGHQNFWGEGGMKGAKCSGGNQLEKIVKHESRIPGITSQEKMHHNFIDNYVFVFILFCFSLFFLLLMNFVVRVMGFCVK